MMLIAASMGGLGLACMIYRRSLLGLLIGLQLLMLGAALIFIPVNADPAIQMKGHIFGLFVALAGIGQLVVGYALAVRLFYLKRRVALEDLRSLRN